jgi:tRNA(adenine34) deaminase
MQMDMNLSEVDKAHFRRALLLGLNAEERGNLPIGAVIAIGEHVVGEGMNAIWVPEHRPHRHAEMEALRSVAGERWDRSRRMTLYTTLEPCLMCMGAIMLHHLGRVLFGSLDSYGGCGSAMSHLPRYFEEERRRVEWVGPVLPEECDPLYARSLALIEQRRTSSE